MGDLMEIVEPFELPTSEFEKAWKKSGRFS